MKKLALGFCAAMALLMAGGCATSYPVGWIYTKLDLPVSIGDGKVSAKMKVGTATSQSVLTLVATGDSSVNTAAKNGDITQIHFVDWNVENILGVIGTYRCTVYGD